MISKSDENYQAVPMADPDPEAPPIDTKLDEEEDNPAVHNAATLEQNQTMGSNRRQDKR